MKYNNLKGPLCRETAVSVASRQRRTRYTSSTLLFYPIKKSLEAAV